MYTLGQAARATGKGKSTIFKAIKSGKISAEKDDHGRWSIEPSEVHRVYQAVSKETVSKETMETIGNPEVDTLKHRVEVLETDLRATRKQNEYLEAQVEDLRSDRNAWRSAATQKRLTWRGLFGGGKAE